MAMTGVPAADRLHIGFFGMRNAGKSSVVNAVTEQDLSVVSDVKGTTTDPVQKTMELLPIGPVVIIDTPGFDDTGTLGDLRVRKTREILNRVDIAVLVVDASVGVTRADRQLIDVFREKEIAYVIAYNKADLIGGQEGGDSLPVSGNEFSSFTEADYEKALVRDADGHVHGEVFVSAKENDGIYFLKAVIGKLGKTTLETKGLLDGLLEPGDRFILVIPVDSSAPKERLILPQQMMLSEILSHHASAVCVQPEELPDALEKLGCTKCGEPVVFTKEKPCPVKLVITDSQAFRRVAKTVPENVPLTSFSVLMARFKGLLASAVRGVAAIEGLTDGDTVLISEGCTHHRQCDDIGTYKIPTWLKEYTGKEITIRTSSGYDFPEDLSPYRLIIHCGGCMLNEREVRFRMEQAKDRGVPITNYGITIAYMNHILERATRIFPDLHRVLEKANTPRNATTEGFKTRG
ncbi:[FeFe] hydrogenase H-cluster maturation GTPase HydF [Lachnospiraceae bacterium NK3A20]|nr:[FeFe] hydrogenase H-cluster maturation GTPase HydF [Lachnospiraceae bacterium NK3A20]